MDRTKQGTPANIDVLSFDGGNIKSTGDVAEKLLKSNFNVNSLRTNDTLLYDEWKEVDRVVLKAAQDRLVAVQQLIGRGLTYNIPDGLGKTVLSWQNMSDVEDAEVNMDALAKGRRDRPEYDIGYMPLPVIHKDFSFSIREIAASRNGNMPLDTTMAEMSARKVSEMVEQIFFRGYNGYSFGGGTIRGIEDFPNVNSGSLNGHWDASGTTGANIVDDIVNMKQALIDSHHFGPYGLWLPTAYETKLDEDYVSNYPKTIRERLDQISNIDFIQVADKMSSDKVAMVQLTADVIRMIIGLQVTVVEWDSEGGLKKNFKVMCIILPQPRKSQEDDCGIAIYSE